MVSDSDPGFSGLREVSLAWRPTEEDEAFQRVYGRWQPATPTEVAALLDGFSGPWWLVGGHAIDAFTGVHRYHEDIDVGIFGRDVPHLRDHLGDRFHLWSNHGGTFRIIDDDHPQPLDPLSQIWVREHAQAPWVIDFILNPDADGRWVSKRNFEHVAPLEAVTWRDGDGIRYQNPEIVLLFKAAGNRPKDRIDLASALPCMDQSQRDWLRQSLHRLHPGHPWQQNLA